MFDRRWGSLHFVVIAGALAACTGSSTTTDSGPPPEDAAPADVATKNDVQAAPDDLGVDAGFVEDVAPAVDVAPVEDVAPAEDVPAPPDDAPALDDAPAADAPAIDIPPSPRDPPPLRAYSHGTCPRLVGAPTSDASINRNFRSGGQTRTFRLVVPRNYDGTSEWPVLFAWHWLNASSGSFVRQGELETATEQMRFIAVVPDEQVRSNGDSLFLFDWPFAETWGVADELTFFDDMLACVSQQFRVDRRRVHGVGVSAGGLWLTYLTTTDRANYFASVEVMSGGLGDVLGVWRMEYVPQPNKFPAMVLWGGPSDFLGVNFDEASRRYRDALIRDNHFVEQCVHSSGHAMPPVDPPADGGTRFRPLWQFLLDHPYGLPPRTSPYQDAGIPSGSPSWCHVATR